MTSNKSGWRIIDERIYETFPIFAIKRSSRENPLTGAIVDFVRVEGLDWVNVIAMTSRNELILVKQYRHGCEEYTLEFPGGCVERDESPETSGARELFEETGYRAKALELLGVLYPNPAMYMMKNYFFVAKDVECIGAQKLDSGEDIEVVIKPYDEVVSMVKGGALMHGMAVAGLGLYALKKM